MRRLAAPSAAPEDGPTPSGSWARAGGGGPGAEEALGGAERRVRGRADAERLLDAREVRGERVGRELGEPGLEHPLAERAVGRAEAGAGVDERRAADAATHRERD